MFPWSIEINIVKISFLFLYSLFTNEPIEIRLYCEKGTVKLSYDEVEITYNDGSIETALNIPQDNVKYSCGKDYWGLQHAVQIERFYQAVLGNIPLEISGEEALKTQKIICDIYNNNDCKL